MLIIIHQSPLGKLFNSIKHHETFDCTFFIKYNFHQLNREDQCLIYAMVYDCAGSPNTPDPQWGENHVFDDMNIFISAAKKAIDLKYQQLNSYQEEMVHENIYHIAGEPVTSYDGAEWGRLCAMNILARLADAMAEDFSFSSLDINSQIPLKFDQAFDRFKAHHLYPLFFQKNIFSTENAMRDYYKDCILKGTCEAQVMELCKLADTNPTWSRRQILTGIKVENVFYNQIIMFSKAIIGKSLAGPCSATEKRQLWSMVECLQISQPIHTRIKSYKFAPDGDYKVFNWFLNPKSKKNENSIHGKVLIENIDLGKSARMDHSIFYQYLKKESIFRFYDINTGFFEHTHRDKFIKKLKDNICSNYFKTNDPQTKVYVAIDENETQFPCKSALGKVYQSVIQNKDQKEIERVFSLLTRDEQCKIYGRIYEYAGEPSTADLQWGEHHVFEHSDVLKTAVTNEITKRYEQSGAMEKIQIETKVSSLDENYNSRFSSPSDWGRTVIFNSLPRLADAML